MKKKKTNKKKVVKKTKPKKVKKVKKVKKAPYSLASFAFRVKKPIKYKHSLGQNSFRLDPRKRTRQIG